MRRIIAALVLIAIGGAVARAATSPEPWSSRDGHVHVSHLSTIAPSSNGVVGNYFFAHGWRVYWDGPDPLARAGTVVVSFALAARPSAKHMTARELLQIGVSRDRRVVATCRRAGLRLGDGTTLPDQTINGVTFTAASNSDQSMSQGTTTLDLRAIVGGACYAVDRITETAGSDTDVTVTLPQSQAAADLDALLETLRITP